MQGNFLDTLHTWSQTPSSHFLPWVFAVRRRNFFRGDSRGKTLTTLSIHHLHCLWCLLNVNYCGFNAFTWAKMKWIEPSGPSQLICNDKRHSLHLLLWSSYDSCERCDRSCPRVKGTSENIMLLPSAAAWLRMTLEIETIRAKIDILQMQMNMFVKDLTHCHRHRLWLLKGHKRHKPAFESGVPG